MPAPLARLQAVEADVREALNRTQAILGFLTEKQAAPDIRVAISNSLVVAMVSIVEEGIRSLFIEYIRILEDEVGTYRKFRPELAAANIEGVSRQLMKSLEPRSPVDALSAVRSLLKCLNDEAGFKLTAEEITHNKNNLRSAEVTNLAKKLGIKEIWVSVCRQPAVKEIFPTHDEGQIQFAAIQKWNELFEERNTIVHRISQAAGWGDTIIAPYVEFLAALIAGFALCLADDAQVVISSSAPS
jgi:hypothetical protein